MPVKEGRLVYTPPASETLPPEKKTRKRKNQQTVAKPTEAPSPDAALPEKNRGRPPGSKNRKTLELKAIEAANGAVPKRGKWRPRGFKNKKTLEREAAMAAQGLTPIRKKRGRPKGSKNKKALEREAASISNNQ